MTYESETVKHPGMMGGLKLFLNSADYSVKDIFHTFYSAYNLTYTQAMIEDLAKINLHTINKIDTPLYFLHGKQDFHIDGKAAKRFFEQVKAPYGVWYEKSSHMLHPEDAKKVEEFMIGLVDGSTLSNKKIISKRGDNE